MKLQHNNCTVRHIALSSHLGHSTSNHPMAPVLYLRRSCQWMINESNTLPTDCVCVTRANMLKTNYENISSEANQT